MMVLDKTKHLLRFNDCYKWWTNTLKRPKFLVCLWKHLV